MQKHAHKLVLILLSSAAIAAGCSSSSPAPAGGTGGTTGGGGSVGTGMSVTLTPDATGYIDIMTNNLGIKGSWYAYGDGAGPTGMPPGDCQNAGHAAGECSVITAPSPGSFPNTGGKMCTSGTVAKVIDIVGMAGMPDYSKIWGAGIGVDLNNDTLLGKGVIDATAKKIVGFSFDIDMKPLAGLRVEVQTKPTDGSEAGNDYWGAKGDMSYPLSPVMTGTNVVSFTDKSIVGPKGHVFDPTQIEGIQFHVPTTATAAGTYSFCISNLKMLM